MEERRDRNEYPALPGLFSILWTATNPATSALTSGVRAHSCENTSAFKVTFLSSIRSSILSEHLRPQNGCTSTQASTCLWRFRYLWLGCQHHCRLFVQTQLAKMRQIMKECLSYPSPNAFSRVIGLSNRPLTEDASMLPIGNKKWELHSGIGLERGVDVVAEKLKAISGIEGITHVYYTCTMSHPLVAKIIND